MIFSFLSLSPLYLTVWTFLGGRSVRHCASDWVSSSWCCQGGICREKFWCSTRNSNTKGTQHVCLQRICLSVYVGSYALQCWPGTPQFILHSLVCSLTKIACVGSAPTLGMTLHSHLSTHNQSFSMWIGTLKEVFKVNSAYRIVVFLNQNFKFQYVI